MMDKVDMSLDDIIKSSKEFRRGANRRGRGGGGFRRGGGGGTTRINAGGVGPIRTYRRGGRFNSSPRTPYTRPSGDINSKWQHDMYDGPAFNKRRGGGGGGGALTTGPTKLVVSNLDYGVSNSDIQELFAEFGQLKSASINYDKSGRSMGSANVVFERRADAVKAMKQYNGVPLDGRPMNIELTTSDMGLLFRQASRVTGGFGNRRPRGGRGSTRGSSGFRRGGRSGGRRGGGGRGGPAPTLAELDAELDAYVSKIK